MVGEATDGVDGFIADLARWGASAEIIGTTVVFRVRAVDGAHAGQMVESGVATNELLAWPAVPPHWVHFPQSVILPQVHPDQSDTLPGWTRHSRQIERWEQVTEPGRAWLAHARAVLAGAA